MPTLEFLFDFASPNAYLAWKALPGLASRTGVEIRSTPVLLGGIFKLTGNQSPMLAFAGVPAKLAYEQREIERFVARHAIADFRMNPHFPVNTLLLMRAAIAAAETGILPAFMDAAFHHMWEAPKKMDDPDIVADALASSGLDAAALLGAASTPPVKQGLLANTQAAVERGVFGLPAFFLGDEMYFGKNTLDDIERALTAA